MANHCRAVPANNPHVPSETNAKIENTAPKEKTGFLDKKKYHFLVKELDAFCSSECNLKVSRKELSRKKTDRAHGVINCPMVRNTSSLPHLEEMPDMLKEWPITTNRAANPRTLSKNKK